MPAIRSLSHTFALPGSSLDLHSDFAAYQHYYTSSSYPYREQWRAYHERNTVADAKLQPGEKAVLPVHLEAGQAYRLLCLDTHSGTDLLAAEDVHDNSKAYVAALRNA